ncbi:MAG: hypothetical protein Q8O67_23925 [Deltaproteobacteria bacterium]|nr:hypothetical protein [Deltaproteobacteria bacterium]
MTTRRDPPADSRSPTNPGPATESTALMERPMFSDDDDEAANAAAGGEPKVFDDVDAADTTDPNQLSPRMPAGDDAATGRFDLSSLDDLDGLPSAHISELDGDVHEGGAQTAIMQLPPDMGHDPSTPSAPGSESAEVDLRRWSAGRAGPRHDMPLAGPPPPSDGIVNSTLPALSLDAIRAAAEGLHDVATPPPGQSHIGLPLPPPPMTPPPILRADSLLRAPPPGAIRQLIEDALAAVTGAQACAMAHPEDSALHRQLGRAVAALAQLLDQTD